MDLVDNVPVIDYGDKLSKIIDLLTMINTGIQSIYTMFYIFLVLGIVVLISIFFYKILKSFFI